MLNKLLYSCDGYFRFPFYEIEPILPIKPRFSYHSMQIELIPAKSD